MSLKPFTALLAAAVLSTAGYAPGAVLITQYYEGASFDKWLELTNLGASSADLSTITVTLWSNANTEAWRTGGSPNTSLTLSGSLDSGATIVLSHASAAEPAYALPADVQSSSVINFNGDDSIVVYDGALEAANIVDALSFTDAGAEGTNNSIVRLSTAQGYSLSAGSTFEDFPAVWAVISNAAVDGAAPGTNERLGETTVAPIPEPSTALLGALGLLLLLRRRP